MIAVFVVLAALAGVCAGWGLARREQRAWARALERWLLGEIDTALPADRGLREAAQQLRSSVEALHRERARLKQVLDATGEGALVLDAAHKVLWCNAAARKLLALDADPIDQSLAQTLRHPVVLAAVAETSAQGKVVSRELQISGSESRRVLVRVAPLVDGVAVLLADHTDLRTLEAHRRDFVANVSHELRTPLAAVLAAAESLHLAMAIEDREIMLQFVDIIERKAVRLQTLVDDLLELARIERPDYLPLLVAVPMQAAVEAAVSAIAERVAVHGTRVHVTVPAEVVVRAADKPMQHVLGNLIGNAVAYAGHGATVHIEATADPLVDPPAWRIAVADDGPGIAAEHLPRLFERFYRVDPGRSRDTGGTGLGLAIVKHHVESMGGRVGVESDVGQGARFWFELPAASHPR